MAVLKSTEFLAVQFPIDTTITVGSIAVTIPALHSFMSTLDIEFSGDVMIMYEAQYKLSGFVCDETRTL